MNFGTIYVVATPIGNLGDITLRALEILKSVDVILCEDTRVTKTLLDRYNIKTATLSYHQHSSERKVREIVEMLREGKNLALVTDAGTPGISDPGNQLIEHLTMKQWNNEAMNVVSIPGPSAVIAALSISGLPTDKFVFMGFPPHKKKRQKFFKEVAEAQYTVVFYESSHRIKKCLDELSLMLEPSRKIVICRELTKKFESVYRGTVEEINKMEIPEKGEFAVVVKS